MNGRSFMGKLDNGCPGNCKFLASALGVRIPPYPIFFKWSKIEIWLIKLGSRTMLASSTRVRVLLPTRSTWLRSIVGLMQHPHKVTTVSSTLTVAILEDYINVL